MAVIVSEELEELDGKKDAESENKTLWIALIAVIAFIVITIPICVFYAVHKYRKAKRECNSIYKYNILLSNLFHIIFD